MVADANGSRTCLRRTTSRAVSRTKGALKAPVTKANSRATLDSSRRAVGVNVWRRVFVPSAVTLVLAGLFVACGNCDFEVEQVRRFINDQANLRCVTTSDCVTQSAPGCIELAEAVCGQVVMSKAAAESTQWRELADDASDCGSNSCERCTLARSAQCDQGVCR